MRTDEAKRRQYKRSLVWLRRDLRLDDNVALAAAAASSEEVALAFAVDPKLLASERIGAPIVQAFFSALAALRADLHERCGELLIVQGDPARVVPELAKSIRADAVFYNEDYEPEAIARDQEAEKHFAKCGIEVRAYLDHVYFGADEVRNGSNEPYKIFTPYKRRWLDQLHAGPRRPVASSRLIGGKLIRTGIKYGEIPKAGDFDFETSDAYPYASEAIAKKLLQRFLRQEGAASEYLPGRDFPAQNGTSHLSPQLRAGTIGIRRCVAEAFTALKGTSAAKQRASIETWISELIWRDFYQMILKQFPHVVNAPFVHAASKIEWSADKKHFEAWCEGRTGYPIVDAAMRQLNTYGWMHNRLRMIVASFLTKDLLIDWRLGEAYFMRHLADGDTAANNGGWQWAASTGTDAVPYFRIFNPTEQSKKFDPGGTFIRQMIPELAEVPDAFIHEPWKMPDSPYIAPIVDHAQARSRALEAYANVLGKRARG